MSCRFLMPPNQHTPWIVVLPWAGIVKMIAHLPNQCFYCDKELDFSHKRTTLMHLWQERFFQGRGLV